MGQVEEAGRSNVDSEVAEINAFMTSEQSSDEKPKKVEKESVTKQAYRVSYVFRIII